MENRSVGKLIVGIAALIGFIIYSFNKALTDIVSTSCSHGEACPMWGTIEFQTNVSLGVMVLVAAIGVYMMKNETAPMKKKAIPKTLTKDEKKVIEMIAMDAGTIFQGDIVEKTKFPKAKVTRILDRLEGQGIIERKRRGMSNVVILK